MVRGGVWARGCHNAHLVKLPAMSTPPFHPSLPPSLPSLLTCGVFLFVKVGHVLPDRCTEHHVAEARRDSFAHHRERQELGKRCTGHHRGQNGEHAWREGVREGRRGVG